MLTTEDVILALEGRHRDRAQVLGEMAARGEPGLAGALAGAIRAGHLSIEACVGYSRLADGSTAVAWDLRPQVAAIVQALDDQQRVHQALTGLEPDVGIAVCLAGIDDPARACTALFGDDSTTETVETTETVDADGAQVEQTTVVTVERFAVVDGWAYARGVTSEALAVALRDSRTAEPEKPARKSR